MIIKRILSCTYIRAVCEICNVVHLRNKETHLFGRSPDKEDYRGIKGSHKVNVNSNSVPSSSVGGYARVLAQMAHICTRTFRCMCHNWALSLSLFLSHSLWNSPDASTSRVAFSSPYSFFPFYCLLVLSLLPLHAVKIYSAILRRRRISILPPSFVLLSSDTICNDDTVITNRLSSCNRFSISGKAQKIITYIFWIRYIFVLPKIILPRYLSDMILLIFSPLF